MTFKVELKPSSRAFAVREGEVLLDAARAAGIAVAYSCKQGACGWCTGKVLAGKVDHGRPLIEGLTAQEKAQGFTRLCQATALSDLVIEIEELPELWPPKTVPALINVRSKPAPDVTVLKLRLPVHKRLMFAAGQYVDILFADGARRSYSIANEPLEQGALDVELHVREMPGGLFSDQILKGMQARERIVIEAPLGSFYVRDGSEPIIFLASGTGYAPIRSMIVDAIAKKSKRPMRFYWGGRRPVDLYRLEEAQELARAAPNLEFIPVVSEPAPGDKWSGRTGLVHRAVLDDHPDLRGYHVYACGAPVMVNAAKHDFVAEAKLDPKNFFFDSFITRADVHVDQLQAR